MLTTPPTWTVLDSGSFASVRVNLPAGTCINCESDAVITISDGVKVGGTMSGGFFASLARMCLTNESFFTERVENTHHERQGDVLLAPAEPGGIVLHRLEGRSRVVSSSTTNNNNNINNNNDDILLVSGSYVASDQEVQISSKVQSRLRHSLLSGTGLFLLRAHGRGTVALAAFGSVHKFVLGVGETRAVDNGHIVAWTASMPYRVGLAVRGGIYHSMTSGEGLMCFFEGPGVVYVQSHKSRPSAPPTNSNQNSRPLSGLCAFLVTGSVLVVFFWFACYVIAASSGLTWETIIHSQDFNQGYRDYRRPFHFAENGGERYQEL